MRNPHAKVGERERKELLKLFQKSSANPTDLSFVFKNLFSPTEQNELVVRWQIIKMLQQGRAKSAIARQLKTTNVTVLRWAQLYEKNKNTFDQLNKKSR
ncbi:MAG: hypothetical protein COU09_02490 [Candidatus Harrisonbacteria bacterium CG10_big_fil_rev_8_21_14_0_10_44_23]|uniref:Uncharacterized protein n=1 Tax=Candidatus Harrisonbacteria bacterium CG10_big_fil_rev_8_21_14_0_10_44_23 TaxID=1974585 RepID=A0A2H0URI9_9BACT|nr:MAG: hypothetical protein COU09_02490 [Candidatus Harrisonbacteria bacterium CG10_big_fil_rev_8_21_14_0_10_44_23]